jgi:hypothetical protein
MNPIISQLVMEISGHSPAAFQVEIVLAYKFVPLFLTSQEQQIGQQIAQIGVCERNSICAT